MLSRQAIADAADTLVVKVGTRVLTYPNGALDETRVASLAEQLAEVVEQGRRVVLVSSGAVGAGMGRLGLERRPRSLDEIQAVASVGQSCLIEAYNRSLETYGLCAAQVLLTFDDFSDRSRYLNVRNTLFALFQMRTVPIVNENDAVRVDELQRNFGDNDRLAAMVTNLLRAPLLVLLSDVEGVYDLRQDEEAEPRDQQPVLPHIDLSEDVSGSLVGELGGDRPQLSVGGMQSKLNAARLVTTAGERVIIANGRRPNVLRDILAGREIGTLITGHEETVSSRKRWIREATRYAGVLTVDDGAVRALTQHGRSLLAVGIVQVTGEFVRGDVVAIHSTAGEEIARGLINYSAADVRKIAGSATERFTELLGHRPYEEVVHRDNLSLVL